MRRIRFIIIGGFLGAGKTTALSRLAKHFSNKGLCVGLITNDQADNLVDTHLVKIEGFNVEEVTGGCFCCRLEDLTDAAERLLDSIKPDIILAEPVGSCTDLIATVIQPLKLYAKEDYSIDPYTVLVDPFRAQEIIVSGGFSGFSENVTYIFKKQLEESDIIVLNKIDTLKPQETKDMLTSLSKKFPQAKVMGISARTGEGFGVWIEALEAKGNFGRNIVEVDYDVYAKGEAELAWLNLVAELLAKEEFDLEKFLKMLAEQIRQALSRKKVEVAHLKLVLATPYGNAVINLVRNSQQAEISRKGQGKTRQAKLIVNARVHTEPEILKNIVVSALQDLSQPQGIKAEIKSLQSFQPSYPVPVHRFKEPLE